MPWRARFWCFGFRLLQGLAHRGFFADLVECMDKRLAEQSCSSDDVIAWLTALIMTRTLLPVDHLSRCLSFLALRWRRLGDQLPPEAATAAPAALLRLLLLSHTQEGEHGVRGRRPEKLSGFVGELLTACAMAEEAQRHPQQHSLLADVAWLVRHRPPAWWRPPALHHSALLESAALRPLDSRLLPGTSPDNVGYAVASSISKERLWAALQRLRCNPVEHTVTEATTRMTVAKVQTALPDLKLVLQCSSPAEEIWCLGGEESEDDAWELNPLLQLRQERLRHAGWNIEVIRDCEWPDAAADATMDDQSSHQGEELLLRRKLAGALQLRVPTSRRRRMEWASS
eukprot:TRINITY_DN67011_c0_g1_i2.p1 TRINITY_DN67011_c0_g1~~TRINITY_DN67011_c0_g1_i2.p1  ORF type:complete len:342 (-),score=71.65 TRINITY_DN67011_c0_g1_i2:394-1419(-)